MHLVYLIFSFQSRRFLNQLLGAIHGTMACSCSGTCRSTLRCRRLHRGGATGWLCSAGLLRLRCTNFAQHRSRCSYASFSSGMLELEDDRCVAPTSSSAGASTSHRKRRRRSNDFSNGWRSRWGGICRWRQLQGRFHGAAGRWPASPAGSLSRIDENGAKSVHFPSS